MMRRKSHAKNGLSVHRFETLKFPKRETSGKGRSVAQRFFHWSWILKVAVMLRQFDVKRVDLVCAQVTGEQRRTIGAQGHPVGEYADVCEQYSQD
jgi:hypothetical protein